jgi:hypothetical protein
MMNPYRKWIGKSVLLLCCAIRPLCAQDTSIGVPVFVVPSASGGDGTLTCEIDNLLPGNPTDSNWSASRNADATGKYLVTQSTQGGSVTFSPPASIALQPNHVYWAWLTTSTTQMNQGSLKITAPQGYSVMISNAQQSAFGFSIPTNPNNSSQGYVTIPFSIVSTNEFSGNAGTCSEMNSNQVRWQVALGWLMTGQSAGTISLADQGSTSPWGGTNSPVPNLYVDSPCDLNTPVNEVQTSFGSIFPFNIAGTGYIRTNQACVQVSTDGSTTETIKFYPWGSQVTGTMPNYSVSGTPYIAYTISLSNPTTLTITCNDGGQARTTSLSRTGSAAPYSWSLSRWGTSANIVESRTVTGTSGASYTETRTVGPSGAYATTVKNTYTYLAFGPMLTSSLRGSSDSPGITSISYNGGPGFGSGMPSQQINADGSFANYTYTPSNNEYSAMPSTISVPYTTGTQTPGLSTNLSYQNDEFGVASNLSTIQTEIGTSPVSNSTYTFHYFPQSGLNMNGVGVTTLTKSDYLGGSSSNPLTTTTLEYSEVIPSNNSTFLVGRPISITNPDGTKTSFVYQYGSLSGSQFVPQNASGNNPPGSCVVAIHGSALASSGGTYFADGTDAFVYPNSGGVGYTIDPLYVCSGGVAAPGNGPPSPSSTLESTIRDSNGLVVRTETYGSSGFRVGLRAEGC